MWTFTLVPVLVVSFHLISAIPRGHRRGHSFDDEDRSSRERYLRRELAEIADEMAEIRGDKGQQGIGRGDRLVRRHRHRDQLERELAEKMDELEALKLEEKEFEGHRRHPLRINQQQVKRGQSSADNENGIRGLWWNNKGPMPLLRPLVFDFDSGTTLSPPPSTLDPNSGDDPMPSPWNQLLIRKVLPVTQVPWRSDIQGFSWFWRGL